MKSLFLTLDYELFGNGSGDVFKQIIEPTKRLLTLADAKGIKFTFFFEVIEYWKLKEEWNKGNAMGYDDNPIVAMETQIRDAFRQGHDVQLHLHPQWIDAYWQDGKWNVNLEKWRLGGYYGDGDNTLVNLLKRGKQTLEDLLRPVNPQYKCIAIRAGGYNVQPSENIVVAMKEAGLFFDSSIYPGGVESGSLSRYDYSNIDPAIGMWHVGEKLEERGASEIVELPIVAFPMIRWKNYLTWERLKGFLSSNQSAKEKIEVKTSSSKKKSSNWDKVKFFFQTEWQTWDFCLFSSSQHKKYLKEIAKQDRNMFVLVGHPKSLASVRGLKYLLKNIHNDYTCEIFQSLR